MQGVEVIAAADVLAVDENLGHGFTTTGFLHHVKHQVRVFAEVNFSIGLLEAVKQLFGLHAVGAVVFAVDDDFCWHRMVFLLG